MWLLEVSVEKEQGLVCQNALFWLKSMLNVDLTQHYLTYNVLGYAKVKKKIHDVQVYLQCANFGESHMLMLRTYAILPLYIIQ